MDKSSDSYGYVHWSLNQHRIFRISGGRYLLSTWDQGEPLEIVSIQDGQLATIILGNDVVQGQVPQAMIPANTWFASRIKGRSGYSLVSCTVAPGFDFLDFELAKRGDLINQYPLLAETIEAFTK